VISDDTIDNNRLAHVRIVVGIGGDGTVDGASVSLLGPASVEPDTTPTPSSPDAWTRRIQWLSASGSCTSWPGPPAG
jgi:hypothetical protein